MGKMKDGIHSWPVTSEPKTMAIDIPGQRIPGKLRVGMLPANRMG